MLNALKTIDHDTVLTSTKIIYVFSIFIYSSISTSISIVLNESICDQLSTNTFKYRACCSAVFTGFFNGGPLVPLK